MCSPQLCFVICGVSMKELSVTLAYFVEWKVSVVHSAPCAVFAHLLPHCDKLSHLLAECYFSLRAWQHLCSLCTSFLSQLTDNVLVAYHHKHKCVCPWTHTHTVRQMISSRKIWLLIVTLECSKSRRVQPCIWRWRDGFRTTAASCCLVRKMTMYRMRFALILFGRWLVWSRSRQPGDNVPLLLSARCIYCCREEAAPLMSWSPLILNFGLWRKPTLISRE